MRNLIVLLGSLALIGWCFGEQNGRKLLAVPEKCQNIGYINGGAAGTPNFHVLQANSSTVHWGYFYDGLQPALVINSGDEVFVEMITHHAGDDYDKMIRGDYGIEDIFSWDSFNGPKIATRGATGQGDGVHLITGPIYVCGAEPGDVLQVDILELKPRLNPQGKSYASNAAAWWGFHQRIGFKTGRPGREVITIYEIETDDQGFGTYAVPDYQFNWLSDSYGGPQATCLPTQGEIPRTLDNRKFYWNNLDYKYAGSPPLTGVPCENGFQRWGGIYYPGLITPHPTGTEDYSIRGKFKIPVQMHPGVLGLAPAWPVPVNAIPPMVTGGNLDSKRIQQGTTMYLPIQVEGALLSMGDAHAAQGDGELDGTGIEVSANGRFRVTLKKKNQLGPRLKNLDFPLLETQDYYVVHGFTYKDYLNELKNDGLYTTIFGLSNIDRAMNVALENTINFVTQAFNLTEDQALTAVSNAADFGITQVVDGNWGVHAILPKTVFQF